MKKKGNIEASIIPVPGDGKSLLTNPYSNIVQDEVSGVYVPSSRHLYWQAGYDAALTNLNNFSNLSSNERTEFIQQMNAVMKKEGEKC